MPHVAQLCAVAILALRASAQFGTITIDWVAESSMGADGDLVPRIDVGGDDDATQQELRAPDTPGSPAALASSETWELAWWRDGFAEDTRKHWFGGSEEPRGPRPSSMVELDHRVGTIFRHRKTGARGVIVGWDARTRAPRAWLDANVPSGRSWSDRMRRLYSPHYSVLEERGGEFMQRYIVAHCEEAPAPPCIEIERPARPLSHPDVAAYFDRFDANVGYVMSARWAERYPEDDEDRRRRASDVVD